MNSVICPSFVGQCRAFKRLSEVRLHSGGEGRVSAYPGSLSWGRASAPYSPFVLSYPFPSSPVLTQRPDPQEATERTQHSHSRPTSSPWKICYLKPPTNIPKLYFLPPRNRDGTADGAVPEFSVCSRLEKARAKALRHCTRDSVTTDSGMNV